MAYVNVLEWKAEQVADWLRGLDDVVYPYAHFFLNNDVTGQGLLNLTVDDLYKLHVEKLGHQEIILESLELLRNFHYNLDQENLQYICLRLSCKARSLYNEMSIYSNHTVEYVQNVFFLLESEVTNNFHHTIKASAFIHFVILDRIACSSRLFACLWHSGLGPRIWRAS